MLGMIVSSVSGMPYQQFITKNILLPLGMTNTKWEYSEVDPKLLALGYRWEDSQWKEEPLLHQLRGKFFVHGEHQDIEIFLTLTPEHAPKIQQLDIRPISKLN